MAKNAKLTAAAMSAKKADRDTRQKILKEVLFYVVDEFESSPPNTVPLDKLLADPDGHTKWLVSNVINPPLPNSQKLGTTTINNELFQEMLGLPPVPAGGTPVWSTEQRRAAICRIEVRLGLYKLLHQTPTGYQSCK